MIVESHKQFLKCILQGNVKEAHPGRRRTSWLKIVTTWFKKNSTELFLLAVHKLMIARIVSIQSVNRMCGNVPISITYADQRVFALIHIYRETSADW